MDAIVTEAGVARFGSDGRPRGALPQGDSFATIGENPNSRATYASPPCFMHELDPSYLGLTLNRDDRSADEGPADPDTSNKTDAT